MAAPVAFLILPGTAILALPVILGSLGFEASWGLLSYLVGGDLRAGVLTLTYENPIGSIAAIIQATFHGAFVPVGSTFAIAQHIAAVGLGGPMYALGAGLVGAGAAFFV